jgi:predicted dehydrogenase
MTPSAIAGPRAAAAPPQAAPGGTSKGEQPGTPHHRCVVVGAGSIGRRHLRNLASAGVDALALRSHRGQSGALDGVACVTEWEAVAAWRPTMAIVANPTACHADAALAAVALGCHVLVEKPVAATADDARRLTAAVALKGTVGLVGYQFRFHPTLQAVRGWIADGCIGRPVSAQVHWGEFLPGWHPGEDHRLGYSARRDLGGGVVLTLSHPIDYVRWLLGEIVAVSAMTARPLDIAVDVEEVAALSLRLADGTIVSLSLDFAERPPRHMLHIVGSEGSLSWSASTGVARAWHAPSGRQLVAEPGTGFERNAMFVEELRHFIACAEGREVPTCSLHDGQRAVEVAEAALRSAASGVVVRV